MHCWFQFLQKLATCLCTATSPTDPYLHLELNPTMHVLFWKVSAFACVCMLMYLLMSSVCAKTVVALQEHLQIELDTTIFGDIQILCIIICNY